MRFGVLLSVALSLASPCWLQAQQVQVQPQQAASGLACPTPSCFSGLPGCSFNGCNACDPRIWVSGDYLLWWVKGPALPPLATTGPYNPNNPGPYVPAALGSPGTQVLFGGSNLNLGALSGMRFGAGGWLDAERTIGLDVGGFFFPQMTKTFSVSSTAAGDPFLGVPFFDTQKNIQAVASVSHPNDSNNVFGGLMGGIVIPYTMEFWGAEGNFDFRISQGQAWRLDGLAGFRFLNLNESLGVQQTYTPIGQPLQAGFQGHAVDPGQTVIVNDGFGTRNQFYGGQLGARFSYLFGRTSLEIVGKVALGDTVQDVGINGQATWYIPGHAPVNAGSGMLAATSNIGNYQRNAFGVVPEVGMNLGYDLTSWLRLKVGYTFMYWSSVVRPGDQIDRNLDPRQSPSLQAYIPGYIGHTPAPFFNTTNFWAQGLNLGLELRF